MSKNLGVITAPPRPKDYILGGVSSISVDRKIQDWHFYLPKEESQRNKVTDFLDCVTMSALHSIECQLNYLLSNNQLSDEAICFFLKNNYISDGSFSLSVRFNAKLNGTDKKMGQTLAIAADCFRRDGLLPNIDWPMKDDMNWNIYYKDVPNPPFKQILSQDYEFPLNMQYLVTVKPIALRNGMQGTNVLQLQKDLNKLGFLVKEDSDFGPKTEIQVKSFQNKTALKPDGIAGMQTLSKLKELLK